jgi:hypothetical protein
MLFKYLNSLNQVAFLSSKYGVGRLFKMDLNIKDIIFFSSYFLNKKPRLLFTNGVCF